MQVADFLAAAGVDPYAEAEALLSARPAEIAALGEAFVAAAAVLQGSGELSALAGQLADASAVFDGASPTELMAEVGAVQQTLAASPQALHGIGAPLCALAGETALGQQQACAALADLAERSVPILQSYAQTADVLTVGAGAWWNQHVAAGAAVVHAAHAAVQAAVAAHDARLAAVLAELQAVGYIMPVDVDAGIAPPPGAGSTWASGPDVGPYHRGSGWPTKTADWWAGLSAAEQTAMVQLYPGLLPLLHGLPPQVYHVTNLRGLLDDTADATAELDELAELVWQDPELTAGIKQSAGITGAADIAALSEAQLDELAMMLPSAFVTISAMVALRAQLHTMSGVRQAVTVGADGKDRYLLEYDLEKFDGDGAAVIGIGEVHTADNVAVVVQGATHDLDSITAQAADAEAVLQTMQTITEDDNAVIVYAGYDNPGISEALFDANAQHGGLHLADDVNGYAAAHAAATGDADLHLTVIGHSYGTLTAAYAMQYGAAAVDDYVLYGSPGLGVDHVTELGEDPQHVYVGIDPSDVLVQLDGISTAFSWNHLGPDPANPAFGATVLGTGGVDGHGDYFGQEAGEPNEALLNAAAIAADRPDEAVVIVHASPLPASTNRCVPP